MEVQFYDEIEFETFAIEVPRDVVVYSFIVQKSLMCLDLSACEYTLPQKSVFTEEQCRKLMEPRRQILYRYHLDLPQNLESSLRAVIPNADDQEQYEAFHLGVMFVCDSLYTRDLASCVINPIMSARNKMDKLRRYLNVMKLLNFNQCRRTAMLLFDHLILALYPYCLDSNLVVEFAITFRFCSWLFYRESAILVGYVLHHAMKIRYNICQVSETGMDHINGCIVFRTPGNIGTLLLYGNVLRFQQEVYLEVLGRCLQRRMIRRIVRKNIPDRRLFLMLQLLYYFTFNNQYWYGLLYIWRSIPDPCLSKSEIRLLFGNVISSRRLHTMIECYKFYIVEETDEMDDEVPRPLQHLCRVAVRSALIRNFQLPYGVSELGMPHLIRDYLNLES
ncbi:hypothetical protein AVEN_180462-1 [Araneus ventricosus]|uniref:SOCS box domain-containing protein n=1 Tax=Araneus ventricosus TaxID=182803 RepID=A0A4Y2RV13_ARAVE|nr:hypothetical protein AVEN_180462-1 [Araneus ventricosus]